MKYVFIKDGMVHEIVPKENPLFPGLPIEKRYSKAFLDNCVAVPDDREIPVGWFYQDGEFVEPPEIEEEVLE